MIKVFFYYLHPTNIISPPMKKLSIFLFCIFSYTSQAQDLVRNVPDFISAFPYRFSTLRLGDTMLVGGNFSYMGRPTGNAIPFDLTTQKPLMNFPKFNGRVSEIVPDNKGGWYIGGEFTKANELTRNRIAHVDSSGNLTELFKNLNFNAYVKSIVPFGDTLMVGGSFTNVTEEEPRNYFTAIDPEAGFPLNNFRFSVAGGGIFDVEPDGNGGWYVAGTFTLVNGITRNRFAHFLKDGTLGSLNINSGGQINSLEVVGNKLYLGGVFSTINGQSRTNFAVVDRVSGILLPLTYIFNLSVNAIRKFDTLLYIAGAFGTVNGLPRSGIASINLVTDSLTNWNPNIFGTPLGFQVNDTSILAYGDIISVGGQPRSKIAIINRLTGVPYSWTPPTINSSVRDVFIKDTIMYIGGFFTTIGTPTRNRMAALSTLSGQLLPFNPNFNSQIQCFKPLGPDEILIGGAFTTVGGATATRMARLKLSTSQLLDWNTAPNGTVNTIEIDNQGNMAIGGQFTTPYRTANNALVAVHLPSEALILKLLGSGSASDDVEGMVQVDDSLLYFGGAFTLMNGQSRSRLAALNLKSLQLTNWAPVSNGVVNAVEASGNTIYVGGGFTQINSTSKSRLAAIDKTSGLLTPWSPEPNGNVYCLKVNGSKIYVGGDFTGIGGQTKNRLAEINLSNGQATFWGPNVTGPFVLGIEVFDTIVAITGSFTLLDASPRLHGGLISLSGNILPFDPGLSAYADEVKYQAGKLYFGGTFKSAGGVNVSNIGAYRISTGELVSIPLTTNGEVAKMTLANNKIYLGGTFNTVNGSNRGRIARINRNNFSLDPINMNANAEVNGLIFKDSILYISWKGTSIYGQTVKRGIVALNTQTDSLTGFNLNNTVGAVSNIEGIELMDSLIFLYGGFVNLSFSGQNRSYVAQFNRFTGAVTSWAPITNGILYDLKVLRDSLVIIGGAFTSVNTVSRNRIAGITLSGALSNWNPGANSDVKTIDVSGNQVTFVGLFTNAFGQTRNRSVAMNPFSLLSTSWKVDFNNYVQSLYNYGDTLYMGGSYTTVNGGEKYYYSAIRPILLPILNSLENDTALVCEKVLIRGRNLGTTSEVTLSGALCTFTVLNDSLLEIQTPTLGVSGPVVVTNPSGASNSLQLTITTIAAGNIIAGPDTVCAGSAGKLFTVNPIPFATSYVWSLPLGYQISSFPASSSSIFVTFGPNALTGAITVRGASICQIGPASPPKNVFIRSLPIPPTLPTGPGSICPQDSNVSYTVATVPNTISYDWQLPQGMFLVVGNGTNSVGVQIAQNAQAGAIKVRGFNSCGFGSFSNALNISLSPSPVAVASTLGDTTFCVGQNVVINANLGAGLGYQWLRNGIPISGAIFNTYLATQSGAYRVITKQNGCQNVSNPVNVSAINANQLINLTVNSTPSSCNLSTGTATAVVSGGVLPYRYHWSSGDTTLLTDSLLSGVYTFTVTDASGCAVVGQANVNNIGGPAITLNSIDSVSCFNGNDGAINLTVSGGLPPYTILWSNGQTTGNATQLTAGVYQILVSDTSGCETNVSYTVGQPLPIQTSFTSTPAGCNQSNGSLVATVTGGRTPYAYFWDSTNTGPTKTNISAGVYPLLITDANSCQKTFSAPLGNSTAPVIVVDSVIASTCNANTGSIQISVTGGTPPLQYNWSNGQTIQDIGGIPAGTYNLTVRGADSCQAAISVTVPNKPLPITDICLVTVDSATRTNQVVWEKPNPKPQGLAFYRVYRESNVAGVFIPIGIKHADSLSVLTDSIANPLTRSWRYRITSVDSCGNESLPGGTHKTVHLIQNFGVGGTINLIWDNYQGFNVNEYAIFRNSTTIGWQKIDSLPLSPTFNSYTDASVPSLTDPNLFYVVDAVRPGGCLATEAKSYNTTRSNTSRVNNLSVQGLWETKQMPGVRIYPNPFGEQLQIETEGSFRYEVLDLLGRVIERGEGMEGRAVVKLNTMAQGNYLIKLYHGQGVSVHKVLKE
jgi:hypothetical protein